jgi:glycosyltransferase involved in cell wall biosynthesis
LIENISSAIRVLELAGSVALYGAERWILALVKNLDRQKIQPIIGALNDEMGSTAPLCDAAVRMDAPTFVIQSRGRVDLHSIRRLRQIIQKQSINILHTHGYKLDLQGRLATWGTQCKIVTTPHGWTHNPDMKLRLYENLDRAIFPLMDRVAPLSDEMHRQIAGIPGMSRKLRLIRNGVDLDELSPDIKESPEMSLWKSQGHFVVGFIGRLIGAKGPLTLLRAIAQMTSTKVDLAVVGSGPDLQLLKEAAQSLNISTRVAFFGYREDRLSFIKAFNVLALPSLSEGIPRCVMEAMGLGIPVVASDIPGCRALIDTHKTGILVPPGSESELANALEYLRNNPGIRVSLAKAAKEKVIACFSAGRMAREYEELFLDMTRNQ